MIASYRRGPINMNPSTNTNQNHLARLQQPARLEKYQRNFFHGELLNNWWRRGRRLQPRWMAYWRISNGKSEISSSPSGASASSAGDPESLEIVPCPLLRVGEAAAAKPGVAVGAVKAQA